MAIARNGQQIDDATKQDWVRRCQEEPGFQAALIVETYVQVQMMVQLAGQVVAQMGPAAALMSKMGIGAQAAGK